MLTFESQDLVVVAGGEHMERKLAAEIVLNVCESGKVVGFFSGDLSAEDLTRYFISVRTGISVGNIKRGAISKPELEQVCHCAEQFQSIPCYIDDDFTPSVGTLVERALELKRKRGRCDLIVLSGCEMFEYPVSEFMAALKGLASMLCAPVLVLSKSNENYLPEMIGEQVDAVLLATPLDVREFRRH